MALGGHGDPTRTIGKSRILTSVNHVEDRALRSAIIVSRSRGKQPQTTAQLMSLKLASGKRIRWGRLIDSQWRSWLLEAQATLYKEVDLCVIAHCIGNARPALGRL